MNEIILKALMRLFAIVADVSKSEYTGNERDIVIDYLDRQYSEEIVHEFIAYFDEQVKYYHPEGDAQTDEKKGIPFESIIEICQQNGYPEFEYECTGY